MSSGNGEPQCEQPAQELNSAQRQNMRQSQSPSVESEEKRKCPASYEPNEEDQIDALYDRCGRLEDAFHAFYYGERESREMIEINHMLCRLDELMTWSSQELFESASKLTTELKGIRHMCGRLEVVLENAQHEKLLDSETTTCSSVATCTLLLEDDETSSSHSVDTTEDDVYLRIEDLWKDCAQLREELQSIVAK